MGTTINNFQPVDGTVAHAKIDSLVSVVYSTPCSVCLNVLSNAFKYLPINRKVILEIKQRTNHKGAEEIGMTVEDKGIGMSPQQIDRLFERFWRADNPDKLGDKVRLKVAMVTDEIRASATSGFCMLSYCF
jgi:signal transduction histidine kinase